MRVLIFMLCFVLLRAAVSDERCDAIDATGNTNFDEDNELLQVNADQGSSHGSASAGTCSIPVGSCAKITTTSTYGPKKAFYGAILKVGSKSEFGNGCILVNIDGSEPKKETEKGTKSLSGMGFDDTELQASSCRNARRVRRGEVTPVAVDRETQRQRSYAARRAERAARLAAATDAPQGEADSTVPRRPGGRIRTADRAANPARQARLAEAQRRATEEEDARKASRDAAAAAAAAEKVARDTAAAASDFVGGRSDVATMSHAEAARRKQAFDFLG